MTTTRHATPPKTGPASEIIDALAPLLAHHRRRWAARCQAHGLSIIGFQVLALLEMHGAIPMSRLAEELDVALPNATGIIKRMAERGLVDRAHDEEDRRIVRVDLTDEGRQLIGEMEAGRRERMTALIGALNASQQRRLLQAVKDLHAAARRLEHHEEPTTT
ncbi:MAG TPA: MarR family transcriptional regulator [Candidatus Limnocylindria bacterium]|nr:MarR family transcriptional regulator [Candidatus Limnocylindria bacterium]